MKLIFREHHGFTLMELMIAVSIVAILTAVGFTLWKTQVERAHDGRRKGDLAKIKQAFEDYYNDHDCYPPEGILDECGGTSIAPYLAKIPCDPVYKTPYDYIPLNGDPCKGYRTLAILQDKKDIDIQGVGCAAWGCGFEPGYNWGIAMGTKVPADDFDPLISPTPIPTTGPLPPIPGNYACTPAGDCNRYDDPIGAGCPVSFESSDCNNMCGDPKNRCKV